jgi:hypothetical protein
MSDARRVSLQRLGREQDELEREVDAFRVKAAAREEERMAALRVSLRRSGIPLPGSAGNVARMSDDDDRTASGD